MGYNFWPIIISFWRYIPDISPKIYLYGDISLYVSKRYNYWAKNISQEIYLQKMLKFAKDISHGDISLEIYLANLEIYFNMEIYLWRYISFKRYILQKWRYISKYIPKIIKLPTCIAIWSLFSKMDA